MTRHVLPLYDVHQTAEKMRGLVCRCWADLGPWLWVDFKTFFNHVCLLPYIPDPADVETISRPAYTLRREYAPRDCDDKAIIIASWLHGHGIKCRFVASSTRPDREVHHVFCQCENGVYLDATFPEHYEMMGNYDYFRAVTNLEPLTGWF